MFNVQFFSLFCDKYSVAPARATLVSAQKAPKGVIKSYIDVGHFEIYYGQAFETAIRDYRNFYQFIIIQWYNQTNHTWTELCAGTRNSMAWSK